MAEVATVVAPWMARVGGLLSLTGRSRLDAMGDAEDVAASLWLAWAPFKTLDETHWIWLLEAMELLDLAARVDSAAVWTLVLDKVGKSAYAPLVVGSGAPLRFSIVVTDRVFLKQSFVAHLHNNGRLMELLEVHTEGFANAKHALLQLLPTDFERSAETRIALWFIQDPDDMHRQAHRSESLLTGLVALAEWLKQQQLTADPNASPLACFQWSRLSLDCFDLETLDRLAPSTVPRLLQLGIEADMLRPSNELPVLLSETQPLKQLGSRGGLYELSIQSASETHAPFGSFRDTCLAVHERCDTRSM